jgi:hypothetical protein
MPWGAAVGAAIGLVGDSMKDDKNGGAGSQTATKEPWAEAAPWLKGLLAQGQGLNDQYTAQPFSAQQQAAYNNQYGQSDYMRQLVPALLGQMSGQQVGFDRNNPTARPQGFNFNGLLGGPNLNQQGLLAPAPVVPPQAPQPAPMGQYRPNDMNVDYYAPVSQLGGGYGSFNYGDTAPQPGTQAYRDYQEYLQWGGSDPRGLYAPEKYRDMGGT